DTVGMGPGGDFFQFVAGFVQDASDGRSTGRQRGSALEHVADALATPGGVGLLEHEDCAPRHFGQATPRWAAARPIYQTGGAFALELALPIVERMFGHADQCREVAGGQTASLPGIQEEEPLLGSQRRRGTIRRMTQRSAASVTAGMRHPGWSGW